MEGNQIILKTNKQNFFTTVLFWVLLFVTFLTPIFFLPATLLSQQFSTTILFAFGVILSIIVYIIASLFYGSVDLPGHSKYILGSIALVPAVYLLAGIANGFSRMSFFGYTFDINTVGFILLGFAYLFLISVIFKDNKRILYSFYAFLISAIILAVFVIVRLIFGAGTLSFGVFTNTTMSMVGSWNNLGIFFSIGAILSLLTLEIFIASRLNKILVSLTLLASLFFLMIVNYNVLWIVLAVCIFLFILYRIFSSQNSSLNESSTKNKFSRIPLFPAIVLVISLVFVFAGTEINSFLPNSLRVSGAELKPSISDTLEVARNTINERPLFGSGPNTFTAEWLKWKPNSIINTSSWNIDFTNGFGLIPTFLVTTGIVGIISWFLFLGLYFYLGVRSIFIKFDDEFSKYSVVSTFFISLYLWMITFVYIPSTTIFILTFFFSGLFFASVYNSGLIKIETRKLLSNPKTGFVSSLVLVAFFVASLSLGYGLFKNTQSLWYFQKSTQAINSAGDISASESLMIKATQIIPNDIYYRSLSEIELIKLNAVASQDTTKVKVEDIQKQFNDVLTNAISAAKAAQSQDPDNYLNWLALGRVYEAISLPELKIEGAYENAQFAYAEALKRNPKNPGILLFLARLATVRKDWAQARIFAEQATELKSNYLDAYFLLSQIEVADNNINAAIKSVTSASVIDPTNPAIFFQLGLLKYNIRDFDGAIRVLEKATTMTPDYANAKYFLGLSYESVGEHAKAIKQFEEIKITNPDSQEVTTILANLKAGKSIFTNTEETKPEKAKTLPVKEKVQ